MVLTVNEEKQKMWVEKADGSAITHDEYKDLGAKLKTYLGGPANAHWQIRLDHWDQKSPVCFTPVKMERKDHDALFHDLSEMIYFVEKKGYRIFGVLEWKESGNWHDDHFKVEVTQRSALWPETGEKRDGKLMVYKQKVLYEPLED